MGSENTLDAKWDPAMAEMTENKSFGSYICATQLLQSGRKAGRDEGKRRAKQSEVWEDGRLCGYSRTKSKYAPGTKLKMGPLS